MYHIRENYPIRTSLTVEEFTKLYSMCEELNKYLFEFKNIRHSESKVKTIYVDIHIYSDHKSIIDEAYRDFKRFLFVLNTGGLIWEDIKLDLIV